MQLDAKQNQKRISRSPANGRRAFTLIELLVVIAIISILSAIAIPAIKSLTKSNDQSQATNLVRSAIASARMIAISQHRMAGVVFFEETSTYSRPVNSAQTAMQFFVEDYNQQQYAGPILNAAPQGTTVFLAYSNERQYLPIGIKLATLNDSISTIGLGTGESNNPAARGRAILFDASGQLIIRSGLMAPPPTNTTPGTYPQAYGDWYFYGAPAVTNAYSSPGFFLYSKAEYDSQNNFAGNDLARANWLKAHSDVVIVNGFTGGIIR